MKNEEGICKCGMLVGENTNKGICICYSCKKEVREHKQRPNGHTIERLSNVTGEDKQPTIYGDNGRAVIIYGVDQTNPNNFKDGTSLKKPDN